MAEVPKYERIGRLVYGFHRWANPERLRDPQALPPAFAERGAELAQRYDAALAGVGEGEGAAVDDRVIVALLEDVEAFARDMHAASAE
jgi:hypothetical protein